MVTGYLVDGQFVAIGRLQRYLKVFGGSTLEYIKAVI